MSATADDPVTAKSFILTNDTPADVKDLNKALTYLSQSPTAEAMLQEGAKNSVTINFISGDSDGDPSAIDWDPNQGLEVNANNVVGGIDFGPGDGPVVGVDSSALVLAHEMAHATDPNIATDAGQANWQYDDNAEQYAVGQEDQVDQQLGEVQRFNHMGALAPVQNPTEHTITNSDGSMSYVQQGADGLTINNGSFTPPGYTQPNLLTDIQQALANESYVKKSIGASISAGASALLSRAAAGDFANQSSASAGLSAAAELSANMSGHSGAQLNA
jgi:Effector protein